MFLTLIPSLLIFTSNGDINWGVLGASDEVNKRQEIEVKRVYNNTDPKNYSLISLVNNNNKISLSLENENEKKVNDATLFSSDLVEIEAKGDTSRVRISSIEDSFLIEQSGYIAKFDDSLEIDTQSSTISLVTNSGKRHLLIFPQDAVEMLIKSKIIDKTSSLNDYIKITTDENNEMVYEIKGQKNLNIFKLYNFNVDINAKVSTQNGKLVETESPLWYKIFGFIFQS